MGNNTQQDSTGNQVIDDLLNQTYGSSFKQNNNNSNTTGNSTTLQKLIGGLFQAGGKGLTNVGNFMNPEKNAFQEGSNKMLKEAGYNQTKQALQAGMSPNDIINHPIMNNNNDPIKIISNLIAMNKGTSLDNEKNGNVNIDNQSYTNDESKPIQNQKVTMENAPGGLFGARGYFREDENGTLHIYKGTGIYGGQQLTNELLNNAKIFQELQGKQPLQLADKQLSAYQAGELNVKRATMLAGIGETAGTQFQADAKPDLEGIQQGLNLKNLWDNLNKNPNNQQLQSAYLDASAKYQLGENAKGSDLMKGRSALSAGFGNLNSLTTGGGQFQLKELRKIQAANDAKYNSHYSSLDIKNRAQSNRLRLIGIDPNKFVPQYESNASQYTKTGTLPDGRRVGMRPDGSAEIISNAR